MKRCSISSIIREMQIIITRKYLCTHTGKAKAKSQRINERGADRSPCPAEDSAMAVNRSGNLLDRI